MEPDVKSRPCGCAWRTVPASELPERVRARNGIGGKAARFIERCAEHAVMCRDLEDWELAMFDEVGE